MRPHLEWWRRRRNCMQVVRYSPRKRSIHRIGLGTTRADRSCMQIHSCNRCTTSIHKSRHHPWQKHHNCKQMDLCNLPERTHSPLKYSRWLRALPMRGSAAIQSTCMWVGDSLVYQKKILRIYPQIRAFTAKKQVKTHK